MRRLSLLLAVCTMTALSSVPCSADVTLPNVFGNSMVLQRDQQNAVWGKASPGEQVTVSIDSQRHTTTAAEDGTWRVMLEPLSLGEARELVVAGKNEIRVTDVLVGEVWICSGQSNMAWKVNNSTDYGLEAAAAKFPAIRMINFPQVGSQESVWSHDNHSWMVCSPETVGNFSAVGYFFARQLHQTLDVPVGMINNAWGGSACEAWIDPTTLAADPQYAPMVDRWTKNEARMAELTAMPEPSQKEKTDIQNLKKQMTGNQRPGNIYHGVLKSHLGYGIRGAIWYQGESNSSRAYQYRELFPLMISQWRKEWGQGDFPFYWVQLADFMEETTTPGESNWAELREAQTMTMDKLAHTGQAVIIDIGEGKDIHPRNKVDVGKRLARWALANEYGLPIAFHSPQYDSMTVDGGKVTLAFDHVGKGWRPFDVANPIGFAIAGDDKQFVWAQAKVLPDGKIEVTSESVTNPVAVRYGWANNPVCNLFNLDDLPLTPFRTDDWKGLTADEN